LIDSQGQHFSYKVYNKLYSLIIDGWNCSNVASKGMVEKFYLSTIPHLSPYKLQWLNKEGEFLEDKHVLVPFFIGKYNENILCDIVPMKIWHFLLGIPWQLDKADIHDVISNTYSVKNGDHEYKLKPLWP